VANLLQQFMGAGTRARVMRSGGITLLEVGGSNFLRLLSNLVLTRLLFPEAFGLMALMQVFIYGLQMFSDIGINTMLIQHKRGEEPHFRNVLWTLQVMRGGVLWLGACALAWPVAWIYDQPMTLVLLPVIGLSLVIEGFKTTREPLANRELMLGRVVTLALWAQVIALLAMVGLAFWLQSVWALVWGTLIGSAVRVIALQVFLPGARDRFTWDWDVAKEAFNFGFFIFLSTIATFFNRMGTRLVLGGYVDIALFGVFSIAVMLGNIPGLITQAIAQKVIFPLYRMTPPLESLKNRHNLLKARRSVAVIAITMSCAMALLGVWLIDVLYDPRYAQAGPMLVLVALCSVPGSADIGSMQALLGHGDSRRHFVLSLTYTLVKIPAIFIGVYYLGIAGAILSTGFVGLLVYPVKSWMISRYASWDPVGEIGSMIVGFAITGTACWIYWDDIALLFP
jgi:O-antigen/teichoic acid export membrane protein